jgi:hypothetical protein
VQYAAEVSHGKFGTRRHGGGLFDHRHRVFSFDYVTNGGVAKVTPFR